MSSSSYSSGNIVQNMLNIKGEQRERKLVDSALDVILHHQEFQQRKEFDLKRRARQQLTSVSKERDAAADEWRVKRKSTLDDGRKERLTAIQD